MKRAKRLVPALVVAMSLSGAAISQAQFICTIPCPVWDWQAILRTTVVNEITERINQVLQIQNERIYKMAWRLTQFIPLDAFVIHPDNRPEWRIFDWWTDAVLVAKPYHFALSYGDTDGAGFTDVSLPKPDPAAALASLDQAVQAELRTQMALLEMADSIIIRGTNEAGLVRFNGRSGQAAIDAIQHDIVRQDFVSSTAEAADKISAAELIDLRDKNARLSLLRAELELGLLENTQQRDGEAGHMNLILSTMQGAEDDEGRAPALVESSGDALRNWQLP